MSDLAMANVEALANGENGSFNCWWDSVDCRICYVGGYWLGCPCVATPASRKTKEKTGNTCLFHRKALPLQPIIPQRVRRSAP